MHTIDDLGPRMACASRVAIIFSPKLRALHALACVGMESEEETLLSALDPTFLTRYASKPPSPQKQPTYCDLEVDGFVTNLPVDHGSFQEGSKEKELLHLPSAVLQEKSRGSGLRSAGGIPWMAGPLGQRGASPGISEHPHVKARCHCLGFQGDHEVFLSPSLSHL